jgi:trans-aconitate methyltransferase
LRWIDIGCGNGAFTELLVEQRAPAEVQGIDPSEAQLAFARGHDPRRAWRSFARRRYGASRLRRQV